MKRAQILSEEDLRHCRAVAQSWATEIDEVVAAVARETGISKAAIYSKKRGEMVDRARQIAMFVARRQEIPEVAIARAFGRERSTVNHNVNLEAKRRGKPA